MKCFGEFCEKDVPSSDHMDCGNVDRCSMTVGLMLYTVISVSGKHPHVMSHVRFPLLSFLPTNANTICFGEAFLDSLLAFGMFWI